MKELRKYNFSAGPSVMPEEVLKKAASEMLDYKGSGMSVMEMSHRGPVFKEIFDETKAKLKSLYNVPDDYEILFLQGGATSQFAAIPMNLIEGGKADYAVTGRFSSLAAEEAEKYGNVNISFSGKGEGFRRIPSQSELRLSDEAKYFYYCDNNTIYGTQWFYIPDVNSELVCDISSSALSKPMDISKFGLLYAGAQKNMAPAGLTTVIVKKSLSGRELPITPKIMSYKVQIEKDSMLNTPPCWCIYMLGLTIDWITEKGGIGMMQKNARERSALLYDFLDESSFYSKRAEVNSRSPMNVTFRTPSEELDVAFCKEAEKKGLLSLKGHKSTGGIRASLYNAMPIEGAKALVEFMKEFEFKNV